MYPAHRFDVEMLMFLFTCIGALILYALALNVSSKVKVLSNDLDDYKAWVAGLEIRMRALEKNKNGKPESE